MGSFLDLLSLQSLPPNPWGHLHLYMAHPSSHCPPFLHGLEVQNDRFSGQPAVVPLSVTNLQVKSVIKIVNLKTFLTY